ncbi:MAG: cation transporter [Pseudomonadota bacterium]
MDRRFRRALWAALAINATMFLIEVAAGYVAWSVALQADALDFLGDAANYAISLMVLGLSVRWRSGAALAKGASMGLFGLWVVASTAYNAIVAAVPAPAIMGAVGLLAMAANVTVAFMLYAFRSGDSNMRSVWLCSRNDAIGNLAVLVAASGVFATGTGWPDLAVGAAMAGLALVSAAQVVRQAVGELRGADSPLAAE